MFLAYLRKLEKKGKPVVFCGDLNVAHTELDLTNPKTNRRNAGFTDEERGNFSTVLSKGFVDTFREFEKGNGHYTWWSQMMNCRARNIGWRVDYFVASEKLRPALKRAWISPEVMGSDHCPAARIVLHFSRGERGRDQALAHLFQQLRAAVVVRRESPGGQRGGQCPALDDAGVGIVHDGGVANERMFPGLEQEGLVGVIAQGDQVDDDRFGRDGVGGEQYHPQVGHILPGFGQQQGLTGPQHGATQRAGRKASASASSLSSFNTASICPSVFPPARRMSRYWMGIALPSGSCHSGNWWTKATRSQRFIRP